MSLALWPLAPVRYVLLCRLWAVSICSSVIHADCILKGRRHLPKVLMINAPAVLWSTRASVHIAAVLKRGLIVKQLFLRSLVWPWRLHNLIISLPMFVALYSYVDAITWLRVMRLIRVLVLIGLLLILSKVFSLWKGQLGCGTRFLIRIDLSRNWISWALRSHITALVQEIVLEHNGFPFFLSLLLITWSVTLILSAIALRI